MKNTKLPFKTIATTTVMALLALLGTTTAMADPTLIRLDLGGNGVPADGFVEYKASSTLADRIAVDTDSADGGTGLTETRDPGGPWFGASGGIDKWDGRDLTNGTGLNVFSGLLGTSDGLATGVSLEITNANRKNAGQAGGGDWRAFVTGLNQISGGGLEAADSNGMIWTIKGLAPNTSTELWIYANDGNYDGTAYTVNGATSASLVSPPRYGGNWTKRDTPSQYNGYGWPMTVTTDGAGTLTGWAKQGSEIRGLQIYQNPPAGLTVGYFGNGNTGGTAPVDPNSPYTSGATVTVLGLGDLVRTGFTFTGWNTLANGSGTSYSPAATFSILANTTLFAQWSAPSYTVTFDEQGGTTPSPASMSVTFGSPYGTLATTSRVGYKFAGWWTGAGGTGTLVTAATNVTLTEAQTLYANWTTATLIRLDLGGNGSPAAGFVEYKASSTLADRIAVDTDSADGGTGLTETRDPGGPWFGASGGNIWDGRDLTNGTGLNTFSGLLDTSDGSATGVSLEITNANRKNAGQAGGGDWRAFVTGLNQISGGGLEAADGNGMIWTIKGLAPNTSTELWIYANDGNYDGTAYTVNGATSASLVNPPRYGGNWTKRDTPSQYNGYGWPMTVTTDGAGTLTGWAKQGSEIRGLQIYQNPPAGLTVGYFGNGNTGGTAPVDPNSPYTSGATVTVLGLGDLVRTGYTFTGWNTSADGSGTSYSPAATFSILANTTLFAQWSAPSYTVTFDEQGGTTPSPASMSVTFGSPYGTLATTSRVGYKFAGWWTGTGGTGTLVTAATNVTLTEAQTLYANWTTATLIRLDLGGNGVPANGFVEYKASSTLADRIAVDTDSADGGTGLTETRDAGGPWFGSSGSNIWDGRDIANNGVSETFTGLLDTSDGSATGVSLAIGNANRKNAGQHGDWRGFVTGLNQISGGGLESADSNGMTWTITGLAPNTSTKLWIYANDGNYDGTAYTVNGVNLVDPPRYGGNWTKRDTPSQYNGYGWPMTVTTDGAGTLTGWAKQGSEIRGLQIYQNPSGEPVAPYDSWAQTQITNIDPMADATSAGNPDNDGANNLGEFAFHGDPLSGADSGYLNVATEDTDGDTLLELTLTLAVRNGSGSPTFAGSPSPSASVDGITYTIEGSLDLAFPGSVVSETTAPTGLPVLPTGWEYRRFRLDASEGLPDKGFLRAKVTEP